MTIVSTITCAIAVAMCAPSKTYCVCAPYPRMPSAKLQDVSRCTWSEMCTPEAFTVAIWY